MPIIVTECGPTDPSGDGNLYKNEIKSNSIENYSAKISNITYAGEAVTPAKLKEYISSNNATISVAKDTETTETLTYGTDSSTGDYYIVTDAAELASITGATAIAGANNEPSIGEAYVYIHGNLYCWIFVIDGFCCFIYTQKLYL